MSLRKIVDSPEALLGFALLWFFVIVPLTAWIPAINYATAAWQVTAFGLFHVVPPLIALLTAFWKQMRRLGRGSHLKNRPLHFILLLVIGLLLLALLLIIVGSLIISLDPARYD